MRVSRRTQGSKKPKQKKGLKKGVVRRATKKGLRVRRRSVKRMRRGGAFTEEQLADLAAWVLLAGGTKCAVEYLFSAVTPGLGAGCGKIFEGFMSIGGGAYEIISAIVAPLRDYISGIIQAAAAGTKCLKAAIIIGLLGFGYHTFIGINTFGMLANLANGGAAATAQYMGGPLIIAIMYLSQKYHNAQPPEGNIGNILKGMKYIQQKIKNAVRAMLYVMKRVAAGRMPDTGDIVQLLTNSLEYDNAAAARAAAEAAAAAAAAVVAQAQARAQAEAQAQARAEAQARAQALQAEFLALGATFDAMSGGGPTALSTYSDPTLKPGVDKINDRMPASLEGITTLMNTFKKEGMTNEEGTTKEGMIGGGTDDDDAIQLINQYIGCEDVGCTDLKGEY